MSPDQTRQLYALRDQMLTTDYHFDKVQYRYSGGFDVIVGNPPYVFARENFSEQEKNFYMKHYVSAQYQINTYFLFIELCVKLLETNGLFGFIVPNSRLMISSGASLRRYLLEETTFLEIVNLLGNTFDEANVETIMMINRK